MNFKVKEYALIKFDSVDEANKKAGAFLKEWNEKGYTDLTLGESDGSDVKIIDKSRSSFDNVELLIRSVDKINEFSLFVTTTENGEYFVFTSQPDSFDSSEKLVEFTPSFTPQPFEINENKVSEDLLLSANTGAAFNLTHES